MRARSIVRRPLRRAACAGLAATSIASGAALAQTEAPDAPLNCVVEPQQIVEVASPVEGVLAEVSVDRGDLVEKGQVVARLESGVEEAEVAVSQARAESAVEVQAARARLQYEEEQLERSESLSERGVMASTAADEQRRDTNIARLALEQAEFNRSLAQLELERAQAQLDRRITRSPIDGVIVDRVASPGEYVRDQAPVVTIAQIDRLNVEVFAPIALYGSIDVGAIAEVELQEPVGGRYASTVVTVDRVLDAASGTFRVRLELPNPDHNLPAGVRCTVTFAPSG